MISIASMMRVARRLVHRLPPLMRVPIIDAAQAQTAAFQAANSVDVPMVSLT